MGVEDAWAKGYTGEGVVVGIADVGVDTELTDLKENINKDWSFNFVQNNTNVTAEHFYNHPEFFLVTNTGNSVANIIGAIKDNNICSAGIAYRSTIVVLKISELSLTKLFEIRVLPKHWTKSDVTTRALVHRLDDIDILVLSRPSNMPFERLDSATTEAFFQGVKRGRNGLGRIYVVSAGAIGNEITNNVNTITVNGMGRYGSIPSKVYRDTSVLISGLTDGNFLTADYRFTTSFNDECVVGFNGVPAATSQVAAIIALALQANPNLSARDIQHLIVRSCHVNGLDETYHFRRNGAGRFYDAIRTDIDSELQLGNVKYTVHNHPYFGFGLLNATTLVRYARIMHISSIHRSIKLETLDECASAGENILRYSFCNDCNGGNDFSCITHVEYVILVMDLKTNATHLSMLVTSPSRTRSFFLENEEVLNGRISGKLVSANFWDESAFGEWKLKISSNGVLQTNMTILSMELYGTSRKQYYFECRGCRCKIKNTKRGKEIQAHLFSERDVLRIVLTLIFGIFLILKL